MEELSFILYLTIQHFRIKLKIPKHAGPLLSLRSYNISAVDKWESAGLRCGRDSPAQLTVGTRIVLPPRGDPPLPDEPPLEGGRGQSPGSETLFFHQVQRWHESSGCSVVGVTSPGRRRSALTRADRRQQTRRKVSRVQRYFRPFTSK